MCGIAGYVGTRELGPDRIAHCLAGMRHRGPDHAASRSFAGAAGRRVHLLATRLDIIDLDARANQPFRVGSKWMAYNGELYNYVELRARLEREGHAFTTTSDTEVLLATLHHFGWEALDECEGMWAFAVYDAADGSVVLARDRFGEKPLYLHRDESGLTFGSEPKCIVSLLGRRLEVNADHVRRYLASGYRALHKTEETFFAGLVELPAGTLLRLGPGGEEERRRYWSPEVEPDDELGYDEAVAGVRERLFRSVELRLRADVPLAFCMSGGVDSSALIAIAKNVCGYDVHAFTVTMEDPRYDEREAVARTVAELGVRHTARPIATTAFLERLRELVRGHDAPVYTISSYAYWLLMELVSGAGYRVAVSGAGADELFTGYYDHHLAYLYEVRDDPALHAASREQWAAHVAPLVRNPLLGDPDLFVEDPEFRDHLAFDGDRFGEYLTSEWAEPFVDERFAQGLLRNRMLNELFREVIPVILHEDDLNAMYHSVENRSPYLDRELFEFCARIPTRYLIRDGYAKAVLRDAVRGVAPDHVVDSRRKVGFNAPILGFLDPGDAHVRSELLSDGPIYDYVRRERIEELLDLADPANSASKFLFSFASAKLFLDEFA